MSNFKGFGEVEKVNVSGFEFRKFGSLRLFEIEWFDDQANKRLETLIPIYQLAKNVATDLKIDQDVAFALIQGEGEPELYQKVLLDYADRLLDVKRNSYTENRFHNGICTMMIQSRVSKKFLKENAESLSDGYGIDLNVDEPQWNETFTSCLPLSTISAIIEFTTNERTEWVMEKASETKSDPVDLGK